jgi:hypothetical protein
MGGGRDCHNFRELPLEIKRRPARKCGSSAAGKSPHTSAGARVCFGWSPSAAKGAQHDCLNRSGKPLRHPKAIGPHSHKTRMIRAPAGMPRAAMFIYHRLWAIKDLLSTYGLVLKPFKNRVASHAWPKFQIRKAPQYFAFGWRSAFSAAIKFQRKSGFSR